MLEAALRAPQYVLFRAFGYPRRLPMNLTVSLTYRCNFRCRTCNIWGKRCEELSLDEFDSIFSSLGRVPYWITMTGGEPFLRDDIVEICQSAYRNCKPAIINIPTNGTLHRTIPGKVQQIADSCPDSTIVVNLSLDAVGAEHDAIRGLPGAWERATKTYYALKELSCRNLQLGVHSVISNFSIDSIDETQSYVLSELAPDSYITEIAEERVELDTIGAGITPPTDLYAEVISSVAAKQKRRRARGLPRITQAFRLEYYKLTVATLRRQSQVIPCYAAFASGQLAPDGDVWACCVRAEPLGNLRETGYDFGSVWFSERANEMRASVKSRECHCPLANASYTNMLMHIPTLARVACRALIS